MSRLMIKCATHLMGMAGSVSAYAAEPSVQVSTPTASHQENEDIEVSPEVLQLGMDYRTFLEREIQQRGLSADLNAVIMQRFHALSAGKDLTITFPRRSFPSIATQLFWQTELNALSARAKRRFPGIFQPRHLMIGPLTASEIKAFLPRDIQYSQRVASVYPDVRDKRSLARFSAPLASLGRWRSPIRIASTGNEQMDDRISMVLGEILAAHRDAPIDASSFPAAADQVNFFITPVLTQTILENCLRNARCVTMQDLVKSTESPSSSATPTARRALFANLYLTNPYNEWQPIALLQHGEEGEIIAAACGYLDAGLNISPQASRETIDSDIRKLRECLSRAMGF